MTETTPPPHRPIRSFVRREGRMTSGQRRALEELWPRFGVEPAADSLLDFAAMFGRTAPVYLEIGFGDGRSLAAMAAAHPENNYLGIEVHRPGVGRLLQQLAAEAITNVRVGCTDAAVLLAGNIPPASLSGVLVFFPDPWPKKRHHKRRLISTGFARAVARALAPGGHLHVATDWPDYAEHILAAVSEVDELENIAGGEGFVPRPDYRPPTKYEQRGVRLGHPVRDMIFVRR